MSQGVESAQSAAVSPAPSPGTQVQTPRLKYPGIEYRRMPVSRGSGFGLWGNTDPKQAARDLRRTLRLGFRGHKFRVKRRKIRGGEAQILIVRWVNGPTRARVELIAKKFEHVSVLEPVTSKPIRGGLVRCERVPTEGAMRIARRKALRDLMEEYGTKKKIAVPEKALNEMGRRYWNDISFKPAGGN